MSTYRLPSACSVSATRSWMRVPAGPATVIDVGVGCGVIAVAVAKRRPAVRIIAIDMEIATIFAVAYARNLPAGAVMLVSDMPLRAGGIKDKKRMREVFAKHTERHLELGLKTVAELKRRGV